MRKLTRPLLIVAAFAIPVLTALGAATGASGDAPNVPPVTLPAHLPAVVSQNVVGTEAREVTITLGDGRSYKVPYTAEHVETKLADGTSQLRTMIDNDAVARAAQEILPPDARRPSR